MHRNWQDPKPRNHLHCRALQGPSSKAPLSLLWRYPQHPVILGFPIQKTKGSVSPPHSRVLIELFQVGSYQGVGTVSPYLNGLPLIFQLGSKGSNWGRWSRLQFPSAQPPPPLLPPQLPRAFPLYPPSAYEWRGLRHWREEASGLSPAMERFYFPRAHLGAASGHCSSSTTDEYSETENYTSPRK